MGGQPKTPNPYETAEAGAQAGQYAANQNFWNQNINETNPYGSKTYQQSGTTKVYDPFSKSYYDQPTYSSNVTLSPAEQNLLELSNQSRTNLGELGVSQSKRMQDLLSKSVDTSGMQAWNAGPGAENVRQDQAPTDRKAVEDAMVQQYQRYAQPKNEAENVQMSLRGLSPGSQGYGTMRQAQGDEFSNAAQQAFLASGQESRASQDAYNQASQLRFNMGGSAADRQNAVRQGQLQEALGLRNQDYNEMATLGGLSQVNTPQFQSYQGSQVQAAPIGQYIYDKYNADQSNYQNKMSGIFGVGQAVAGAMPWASFLSDRRAKQDIEPLGTSLAGVPLYRFRYKADPRLPDIGVMADEAKKLHPDAVQTVDGFDHVNYALLRRRHIA